MSVCAGIGKNFLDTFYLHEEHWTLRNSRRCMTLRSFRPSLTTFIGMVSYYRRLIKNFADIAAPLHNMTKGGKQEFSWTPSADRHLRSLKVICVPHRYSHCLLLSSFHCLHRCKWYRPWSGADPWPGEHEHVIAYASRILTAAERNYSTTEKECLITILWSLNRWRPLLVGVTYHQSLTWLQGLKILKGRLALWILALQFEINHRLGKQPSDAVTLSRFPKVTPTPALEGGGALRRRRWL